MPNLLYAPDFLNLLQENQEVRTPDLSKKLYHTELTAVVEHQWFTYDVRSIVIREGLVLTINQVTSHTPHILQLPFTYDLVGFTYSLQRDSFIQFQPNKRIVVPANASIAHLYAAEDGAGYVHRQVGKDIVINIHFTVDTFRNMIDVPDAQLPSDFKSFVYGQQPGVYQTNQLSTEELKILNELLIIDQTGLSYQFFVESKVMELISIQLDYLVGGIYQSKEDIQKEKLQKCRNLLIASYDHPPSLLDLTKEVGINIYDLKVGFKALFGLPPYQYLKNYRLDRAHKMLKVGLSVSEVAERIGYVSISSFSNAFQQKFGQRPSTV